MEILTANDTQLYRGLWVEGSGDRTFRPQDISSTGRFVDRHSLDRTFGRKDVSSKAFSSTDFSSNGRFVKNCSFVFDLKMAPILAKKML